MELMHGFTPENIRHSKMYKKMLLILFMVLVLFGCQSENKIQTAKNLNDPAVSSKLNEYFQTLRDLKKFNGVVIIQQDEKLLLFEVYNMSESSESTLHVKKHSQFDIHSISKLMAKAVIVDLEKDNQISASDYISNYIPDFPNGDKITIKHLLENQSGLPRGFNYELSNLIEKSPEEIIELIKQESLLFEPGTETLYSNLGYQLVYFIISKIVEKPFVQYLNDIYFEPLGMTNTGAHFHLQRKNLNHLVKNHEKDDGELVVVPNIQSDGKNQAKIYSTVEDLLLFINHIKHPPYSRKVKNKANKIGWSGGGDGILSHAEHNIPHNYDLVFFSNYDEVPFGDILKTVEKIMNNEPYELPQKIHRIPIEVSENILKLYEGKYRVKEFNNSIFEYRVENGKLVMYQDGERGGILNAETSTTFFDEPDAEDYFEFRKIDQENYKLIFYYKKVEIEGKKEAEN